MAKMLLPVHAYHWISAPNLLFSVARRWLMRVTFFCTLNVLATQIDRAYCAIYMIVSSNPDRNSSRAPWQSLKTRATVFTLVVFVLSIWALSWYASRLLQADLERVLGQQQFSTASVLAHEINDRLSDRLQALEAIAKEMDANLIGQPGALQTRLEQRPLLQVLFNGGVFVSGMDGTALADAPLSNGRIGSNYLDRANVATTLKQGKTVIGQPVMGKKLGAPVVSLSAPIVDGKGQVIGALVGTINLGRSSFLDQVAQSDYGQTGGFLLIAAQHRVVITGTDKSRIMESLPAVGSNALIDRFTNGYEGSAVLTNPRGVEVLVSGQGIPIAGWYLLVSLPTAEAFAPVRDLQQRLFWATLLLTVLTGALTWWILKRQLFPLVATADALAALADAQQMAQPLPITRPDEIGDLVAGFNRLLARWTQREAALKDSQQNLAITLNSIGDAVIATDAAGLITRMNPTAERLTAWPLADALGRPLTEVFRIVNASTRAPAAAPVQRVIDCGEVVGLANHTILLARDGREYQIADSAAPIRNADDQIVGVVLVFSDVTEKYLAETALRESEQHFRHLYQQTPLPYQSLDIEANILEVNDAWLSMLGYTRSEVIGRCLGDYLTQAGVDTLTCEFPNCMQRGYLDGPELELICKNGSRKQVLINGKTARDSQGDFLSTHCILTDITERKQTEESLRIAATTFESQQGVTITNAQHVILRVNKAFTTVTGYSAQEAVGQNPRILRSGRHDSDFYAAMYQSLAATGAWAGEIWNRRKNGEVYPEWLSISTVKDEAGLTSHFVAIFSDISERINALLKIDTLAFYDPLTQLPNRRLLLDRLEQAQHVSTRHARNNALLFVDLDNFKTLNDTLGHHQGDLLLAQVAQRLKTCIREGDTIARLGSDEFVVMLENLSEEAIEAATQAETVADKILKTFQQDFALDSGLHRATPSIGITLFGGNSLQSSEQPLRHAELAMFQAKAAGRNTLRFFDARMQAEVSAHAALEADLREAVQQQQFLLYYQPQVMGAGRLTGVEALLRWQHPQRGMVSPAEFIPLAEASGLILPIGQWVLEAACAQLAAWAQQSALAHLTMAVNVSARQFKHEAFVDSVLATLARTQANPKRLKLELTESMLVEDVEAIIGKMGLLKAHGVMFSLDDFGTGYSSLAYLKRLPLDQLKIDQGFVRNIVTDPNDAVITKMVVLLAESMGLSVIAEGVELQAQADFLAHQGCHAYQGYLFSRPLPLAALEAFASSH